MLSFSVGKLQLLLKQTTHAIRAEGVFSLPRVAISTVIGQRTLSEFKRFKDRFHRKHGLEVGGPSHIFKDRSLLPIYNIAGSCDNYNFSCSTVWQNCVKEGFTFRYHPKKPMGYQFIGDATELAKIADQSYDFFISSHVIEHIANPLKALNEWKRVVHKDGIVLTVSPHKERTFDYKRPTTTLNHLKEDYRNGLNEDDLSHLAEILELHDLARDPEAGSYEQFISRSKRNFENRCLHHHVFVTESWISIYDYLNLEILCIAAVLPFHVVAIGRKVDEKAVNLADLHQSNAQLLNPDARWRYESPFRLDKICSYRNG